MHLSSTKLSLALAVTLLVGAPLAISDASAQEPEGPDLLAIHAADPPAFPYDATVLGRATHRVSLTVTNPTARSLTETKLAFRFRASRGGVEIACRQARHASDRWPDVLPPGASFTIERSITCDTPLPGTYPVQVLARPASSPRARERPVTSFSLTVEPGQNPPVAAPWEPRLFVAASGTKEIQPTRGPATVKIQVGLINGAKVPLAVGPVQVKLHVMRRESTAPPCPDRVLAVPFKGSIAPGKEQERAIPLVCDFTYDGVYDVDVVLVTGAGAVRIARHELRVAILPVPHPPGWVSGPR